MLYVTNCLRKATSQGDVKKAKIYRKNEALALKEKCEAFAANSV